jgi:hypothetical protein
LNEAITNKVIDCDGFTSIYFLKSTLHAKKSNVKGKGKRSRNETTTKMHNMEPIHNDPLNEACPQTK